jgi:hypothetical protein
MTVARDRIVIVLAESRSSAWLAMPAPSTGK